MNSFVIRERYMGTQMTRLIFIQNNIEKSTIQMGHWFFFTTFYKTQVPFFSFLFLLILCTYYFSIDFCPNTVFYSRYPNPRDTIKI